MKKLILILILPIFFIFQYKPAHSDIVRIPQDIRLLDYKDYKKITHENIKSLKIIRYTESGISEKSIVDKILINQIYNYLSQIKLTNESKMGCTDNTTIYSFTLNDNSNITIEIECDWIVIEGKNYNFIK